MPTSSLDRRPHDTSKARERFRGWLPFIVVALVYAAVALHHVTAWGVYMDEVDPDYLAVRLLNWSGPPVPAWLLPGNYLRERFVVLVSLQHGSQTLWLGLPGFWLFGTTVAGLRVTHALFALGILATAFALLRRAGLHAWWAALACAALAVDTAFVYAFRTQSYITMSPVAWTLLSLYAFQRASSGDEPRPRWWVGASGFFAGCAFAGYFIYLFFAPAIALAIVLTGRATTRARLDRLLVWCAWLLVGTLPYFIGYALLAKSLGGLGELVRYFVETQAQLGGQVPPGTLAERFATVVTYIPLVFSNAAHHWIMFGEPVPIAGAGIKTALLVALPPALWIATELRRSSTALLRLLLGMELAFGVGVFAFGARLAGHHYVPLVPLAYATLAVALARLTPEGVERTAVRVAYVASFAILWAINAVGDAGEDEVLTRTGGVGFYSDAINRFAADLNAKHAKDAVFLPDWGLMMPAVFLTGGRVTIFSAEDFPAARRALCAGRDVSVALVNGDRAARVAQWERALDWSAPATVDYAQRDGKTVFVLATFSARDSAARCMASGEAAPAAR